MVNYYAAALAFRCLSLHPVLEAGYYKLGSRKTTRPIQLKYTRWVWEQAAAEDCLQPGKRLLELGTGWTYANSLYIGLLGHAMIDAFDVRDNRSLPSLQYQVPFVLKLIEENPQHSDSEKAEARLRALRIREATSIEQVNEVLNLQYHVNASGFPHFPEASFDLIFSMDVLEHVRKEDFLALVQKWRQLLKPGGLFIAQVGLNDHIASFELGRCLKQYLRHSNLIWRILLQSDLQYINRLTASQILDIFRQCDFKVESAHTENCDIAQLPIHKDYQNQSSNDLSAIRLIFCARRT